MSEMDVLVLLCLLLLVIFTVIYGSIVALNSKLNYILERINRLNR